MPFEIKFGSQFWQHLIKHQLLSNTSVCDLCVLSKCTKIKLNLFHTCVLNGCRCFQTFLVRKCSSSQRKVLCLRVAADRSASSVKECFICEEDSSEYENKLLMSTQSCMGASAGSIFNFLRDWKYKIKLQFWPRVVRLSPSAQKQLSLLTFRKQLWLCDQWMRQS